MMKYRKKPVVIEAFRFGYHAARGWSNDAVDRQTISVYNAGEKTTYAEIATLEGVMRADYGDYIIRGVKGELYPCKPDIFEATYEKVIEQQDASA